MTVNCVELGRAVTFMKYFANVVSVMFLVETLIMNKITFPTSNLTNFAELVENKLTTSISKKKIYPHQYRLLLIMNYQSSNFGVREVKRKIFKRA